MREAWFEIIKQTGSGRSLSYQRTPSEQRAADKANKNTKDINRRKEAALQEYRNWAGPQATEFDIKGKTGGEAGIKNIQEAIKLERRKAGQPQKGDYRGKAEVMGRKIKEGAKKTKEGLSQGVRNILGRGKKALSPNTYLPDPSATGAGTGKRGLRTKDPISGEFRFENLQRLAQGKESVKDEKTRLAGEAKDTAGFKEQVGQFQQRASDESKEEALTAEQERQRKKETRLNVASQAGQQAQLDRLKTDEAAKEAKAKEDYAAYEKKLEESRIEAEKQANLDARTEFIAQQKQQKEDARNAKIKQMGEVNRQRAEAARAKANTTVMPKIEGLKPAPVKMQTPAALTGKNMINLNRQSQGKSNLTGPPPAPAPPKIDRKQMANAKKLEQEQQSNPNVFQQMVANQTAYNEKKKEEAKAKKNPNATTQQQTPVNTAPPPQQQNQQQLQQQAAQAAQNISIPTGSTPQPLDPKRSAWGKVLQKPQAPPPKKPQAQPVAP